MLGSASAAPPPNSGNSGSVIAIGNGPTSNGAQGTTSLGSSSTTTNGSATTSGTTPTTSGSLNHTSTDGAFKATFIITGTSTGTSPQTTNDEITVTSVQEQQQQNAPNNISVIIGSAFGAAALVIFAVGCLLWYRRRSQRKHMSRTRSIISTHCRCTYYFADQYPHLP